MGSYKAWRAFDTAADSHDPILSTLFRPHAAYGAPSDVLKDDDLTLYEKRAILSSWASDIWAMDSTPALRAPPFLATPASIDEIMRCLKSIDREMEKRCIHWEGAHG